MDNGALASKLATLLDRNEEWTRQRHPRNETVAASEEGAVAIPRQRHPLSIVASRLERQRSARFEKLSVMLRGISVFEKMTPQQLQSAVGHLTPMHAEPDQCVIKQGDIGDCFYVMLTGEAIVSRETGNHTVEIARLHAPNHFGESALLTHEMRKATVVAGSCGSEMLVLSADAFQLLGQEDVHDTDTLKTAKEAVGNCRLMYALRAQQQNQLFKRMQLVTFRPGEFVINAGEIGKNAYIIIEGICSPVHTPQQDKDEGKPSDLEQSAYFGERSLWRKPNVSSVVAKTSVTCMNLNYDSFHPDYSHLLKKMLPPTGGERKREMQSVSVEDAFGWRGSLTWRVRLVAISKTIMRTRRNSIYRKLYDDATASEAGDEELGRLQDSLSRLDRAQGLAYLGDSAAKVLSKLPYRRSTLDMALIAGLAARTWKLPEEFCKGWSPPQISGLHRTFKFERVPSLEFVYEQGSEGARAYVILRGFVRLRRWISRDGDSGGSFAYDDEAQEEESITLGPGDMFGTEAFEETVASDEVEKQLQQQLQHAGSMQQPCTNDAAPSAACPCHGPRRAPLLRRHTAITGCEVELLQIEHADYVRARTLGARELTLEQKVATLKRAALFKHWDAYRLHRLAYAMQYRSYPKDKTLAREGEASSSLLCIVSGTASLHVASDSRAARAASNSALHSSKSPLQRSATGLPALMQTITDKGSTALFGKHPIKLLTLGDSDYFGDSGLIHFLASAQVGKKRDAGPVTEPCSSLVVSAELVALELPASEFGLFDDRDLRVLRENRRLRQQWRQNRLAALARCAMKGRVQAESAPSGLGLPQGSGAEQADAPRELAMSRSQPALLAETPRAPTPAMISRCGQALSMVDGIIEGAADDVAAALDSRPVTSSSTRAARTPRTPRTPPRTPTQGSKADPAHAQFLRK